MEKAKTVHIIDDDPGMRRSLQMVMDAASLQVKLYESGESFLNDANRTIPECIVLDLRMRGLGGLELLQQLRADGDGIPVIIISGHADVATAVRGMKLGAIDLLQKPFEPRMLVNLVRRALEISAESNRRREEVDAIRERLSKLTSREHDLLRLLVGGLSNKQIASEMGISIKTVANHRAHLMEKTKASNAADLARMSVIAGITSSPTEAA